MHLLDWLIMIVPLLVCSSIAFYSRRYVRGVADFMAGGRHAGRYLICTARAELGGGGFVANFQGFLVAGFVLTWWGQMAVPLSLFLAICGFVIFRYRQTRALTLGQFFEARYSRKFRLFAGFLGLFAGLLNFGIIPIIGTRFMVYFLDLPLAIHFSVSAHSFDIPTHLLSFLHLPQAIHLFSLGAHTFSISTELVLLALFLTMSVIMTTTGGQVSVLLTDCAEGMVSQIFYTFIALTIVFMFFKWSQTREMLLDTPSGKSLVNPFDAGKTQTFNFWYVLMNIFLGVFYRNIAWQNAHAFNSSAATPHEARMGGILGRWRLFAQTAMVTLLSVCALTYLKSPSGHAMAQAVLDRIQDPSTRDQMRAPIALAQLLPVGVKGALLSICLMGLIAGNGMHLHSWGSIFIQDIVLPLRKRPLSPVQHLFLLRLAVAGVAVWAFCFGALFPQTKYVSLWWMVTEAIFVSGAGIAIMGGLYWSRGTAAGAWSALVVGAVLSLVGITVHEYWYRQFNGYELFNLQHVAFFSSITAVICYAVVSHLTCRVPHNMDKLLHRGDYAVESANPAAGAKGKLAGKPVGWLYRIFTLGIDENFSRADRWITIGITAWSMIWVFVFAIGSCIYLIHPWSKEIWANYWLVQAIYLPLLLGVVTTVWFTIGAGRDMCVFFRRLRQEQVDARDDGTVEHEAETHGFEVIPVAEKAK